MWKNSTPSTTRTRSRRALGADRHHGRRHRPRGRVRLANDIAAIVIETHAERPRPREAASDNAMSFRSGLEQRLGELDRERGENQAKLDDARAHDRQDLVNVLEILLAENFAEPGGCERSSTPRWSTSTRWPTRSRRPASTRRSTIVDEHKPEVAGTRGFVLAHVVTVVGIGSLFASALILARSTRASTTATTCRALGLPSWVMCPGFAGDDVGSLRARGVRRRRVTSFYK